MTATDQRLVEEVVAYTRDHLGVPAAASLGVDAQDDADVLLEAICLLSCAGSYPRGPLGEALNDAVAGEPSVEARPWM